MHKNIDFNTLTPFFVNGEMKWYKNDYFNRYITNEQEFNLPKLENLYCFNVRNDKDIDDLVLIDGNQNIIRGYSNNIGGYDQMKCFINMIKINQHFDKHEQVDI